MKSYYNANIRPTSIRNWIRGGWTPHDVSKISRHKNLNTIKNHYDPGMTVGKRLEMSTSLWGKMSKPNPAQSSDFDPGEGCSRNVSNRVVATVTSADIADVVPLLETISRPRVSTIAKSPDFSGFRAERMDEMTVSQEVTTTITRKGSKKALISLDPFEDDGGIDFGKIPGESNF